MITDTAFMKALLTAVDSPLLVLNDMGKIMDLNDAAVMLLKCDASTVQNRAFKRFFNDDQNRLSRLFSQAHPDSFTCTLSGQWCSQQVPLDVRCRLSWAVGVVICHVAPAVSLEQQVKELTAFAYTLAHDLKDPAALLINIIENCDPAQLDEARMHEYRYMASQTASKITSIIDELLLFSQMQRADIHTETLDMRDVIQEVKRRLSYTIEQNQAKIVIRDVDRWPRVRGYAPWVEAIFVNYISNAIKYGGSPPVIEIGTTCEVDKALFWVRDNGSGLSDDQIKRLFTEFERLDKAYVPGHGLGLSIVQRLVSRLGGEVYAESQPEQGSKFWFSLPLSAD